MSESDYIPLGINAGLVLRSSAQRQAMMSRIVALGGGSGRRVIVRENVAWFVVQPTETGGFSWSSIDSLVTDCANGGVEILIVLGNSPTWAVGGNTPSDSIACMPFTDIRTQGGGQSAAQAYATYCGAAAARYGPGGSFWTANPTLPYYPTYMFELWNEPYVAATAARWNGSSAVATTPVPSEYAAIFSLAAAAIHATPGALAMAGADIPIADGSAEYLRPFLQSTTVMPDALSIHTYPVNLVPASVRFERPPIPTSTDWLRNWEYFDQLTDARLALNEVGLASVPIWLTETGWASITTGYVNLGSTQAIAEAQQAARYNDMFEHLRRNERMIQGLTIYCYNNPFAPDQSGQPGYNQYNGECFLGIYHTDGSGGVYDGATCTAKPAAAAVIAQAAIGIPAFS